MRPARGYDQALTSRRSRHTATLMAAAGPIGFTALAVALASLLAVYAVRGWFARYTADDYCTAGLQRAMGFLGAQAYWYEFWSGRFSFYFVSGLVELSGPTIVQILPTIALAAFVAAGAWAVLPIARAACWPVPIASAAMGSAAVVLACLQGAPLLEQDLYWQTGMLTYLLPLVLLTVYAGWLARRACSTARPSRRGLFASSLLLIGTAGLSEVSLAVQLTLLTLGTIVTFVLLRSERRRAVLPFLATGLLASLVGAAILIAAPGNYVHQARVTGSVHELSELPLALRASLDFVGLFARSVEFRARFAMLVLLGLSLWLGLHAARSQPVASTRRALVLRAAAILSIVGCTWLLLMAASFPGYFAQAWDVPERAQFVGVWVLALALASAGYLTAELAGQAARRLGGRLDRMVAAPLWPVGLLLLAAVALLMLPSTLAPVAADIAYAAEWDSLDASIRASATTGEPVVVDRTLPAHYGFEFLTTDAAYYPNPCVAQFYGVPSIRVAP
jgi:hypothetical protein